MIRRFVGLSLLLVLLGTLQVALSIPQVGTSPSNSENARFAVTSYENVTTHEGDLVIGGTQTYTIENCTFIQHGNVLVRAQSELVISNATFQFREAYSSQYEFFVRDYGILRIGNSWVQSDRGFCISTTNSARMSVDDSRADQVACWDRSSVEVKNSSVAEMLVAGETNLTLTDTSVSLVNLSFNTEQAHLSDLQPQLYEYWNLREMQKAGYVGYDITLVNTKIGSWGIFTNCEATLTITNSTFCRMGIHFNTVGTQKDSFQPGSFESWSCNAIALRNCTVEYWDLFFYESACAIADSNIAYHGWAKTNISISQSVVSIANYKDGSGILVSNESIFTCFLFVSSCPFILGNLAFSKDKSIAAWVSSNVTRNYNVVTKDNDNNTIPNAELSVVDRNGAVVWSGLTDKFGTADFNLTFTDNNYTDAPRLETSKGNLSAATNVSFLSDTPVTLVMGLHDVAMMDVTPSKTVVGQGFSLPVNVTVANHGTFNETCSVTLYANKTGVQNLGLYDLAGTSTTLRFSWNTTGFAYGNYSLTACAAPVPYETDTANNNLTLGWVWVGLPGDVQAPFGRVDMKDIAYVAVHFGTKLGDSKWEPNADVNGDNTVDMKDIAIPAKNFGKHYP